IPRQGHTPEDLVCCAGDRARAKPPSWGQPLAEPGDREVPENGTKAGRRGCGIEDVGHKQAHRIGADVDGRPPSQLSGVRTGAAACSDAPAVRAGPALRSTTGAASSAGVVRTPLWRSNGGTLPDVAAARRWMLRQVPCRGIARASPRSLDSSSAIFSLDE